LLLLQAVCAVFDNVGAAAYSATVDNCFLDHACYLTITFLFIHYSFSIGELTCLNAQITTDELLNGADAMMYSVKENGITYGVYTG
jgi:GGDEF domain-containing protein